MAHDTMVKFGYPDTLIREYEHWTVQLRPAQVTLGSLVLIAKSEVTNFADLPAAAFTEQKEIISDIETTLGSLFSYDKINYLMLMMVDPQVHYHVIPRYETAQSFEDVSYDDKGWPGPPALAEAVNIQGQALESLRAYLRQNWGKADEQALKA